MPPSDTPSALHSKTNRFRRTRTYSSRPRQPSTGHRPFASSSHNRKTGGTADPEAHCLFPPLNHPSKECRHLSYEQFAIRQCPPTFRHRRYRFLLAPLILSHLRRARAPSSDRGLGTALTRLRSFSRFSCSPSFAVICVSTKWASQDDTKN